MNRTLIAFMLALCSVLESEAQFHSLYFDGVDDHVELNETILAQHFSFEGWIRFAADGIPFGSDAGSHIVSIGAANDGTNWASFAVGVSLSIEGMPQLTCEFGQAYQYGANEAFPMGEWVHFAVVFDAGALHVYQNGLNVLSTQTPFSNPLGDGNNYFIGSRGDDWEAGAYRFHGEIAQISQWQVALSSSEIQALVGCSQTAQEEGLLSLWTFETGEGGVLVDQVGVNSGQIEGALWSGLMPLFYGCTDSAACNFDACANTHDESCSYPLVIDLGEDIETCEDSVTLDAGEGFGSYLWSTGETSQTITVSESGQYEATVSAHPANTWSLSFDGQDDWVDFGHSEVFHPESDFTWSLYFQTGSHYYQAESSPVQMHQPILNKAVGYNVDGYSISYGNWGGSTAPNYYLWYGQGLNSTMQEAWSDVNLIGLNQWHHLAVVRRNDDVEIYLDGALVTLSSSTESFDDVIENSTGLLLGATADVLDLCGVCPDSTFFDGFVDNLSLWNRALGVDEIQDYAQCPSQGEGEGLVGLWNFEEGHGDTAYDLSGNGNHGAIHGAGWSHQVPQQDCRGCEASDEILVDFDDCDGYCGEGTVWDEILETCVSVCSDIDSGFGCDDTTACNYTPQGLSASFYVDSLNYSIPFLLSQGFSPSGLVGLVYGGGVIYDWEEQDSLLTLHIVHPPEYSDAPVPNMGLSIGSACGAGGEFGGNFFEAAVECEELVLEGHDDWSLPSIDQVEQVYQNLFYSSEYPLNVCATGAFGYFKGIDYLSSTETCRCYFGTGVTVCNSNALGAYEFFPVRDTSLVINDSEFECEYGCHYCGEGTLWDDTLGECVSLNSEETCGEGTVWDEILETCVSVCSDIDSGFGCDDTTACNYTPQGLSASFYVDSLNYSIPFLLSQGFSPSGLVGLVYGGGVIYDWEEQDSLLTLHIVHPPEYSDAPVPNMGLSIGSACGAGGEFGGNFFEAAVECEELVLEGHDDWSLPSIDQVEQVYQNLFYSSEYPLNVCATGAFGYFKGIDYLSSTETCRCYFGTGVTVCNSNALGAYEFFPVRDTSLVINDSEFECEYGCHYCGEGTLWDDTLGECVSLNSEETCGEGTVWDPFNQECIVAIPTDTDFDGCVAAGDLLNLLGTFGSCPPIPFSGPCQGQDHVTYQGYDYDIVAIGEQCWFSENLRSESYRNGDEIPYCSNSCQWGASQEGARSGYGDTYPTTGAPCGQGLGTSGYCFAPTADVVALFGHLYNWYAVMDARELCPSGWSVPYTDDFQNLIELAEGAGEASAEYLKANQTWLQESADSGVLGFKALAGGYGGNLGGFDGDGYLTMFWGTTQSSIGANAEHLQIGAAVDDVFINNNHKQYGQYVRCIKD